MSVPVLLAETLNSSLNKIQVKGVEKSPHEGSFHFPLNARTAFFAVHPHHRLLCTHFLVFSVGFWTFLGNPFLLSVAVHQQKQQVQTDSMIVI
jgi:hypothetical protein